MNKTAVIGCGAIAAVHAKALAENGRVSLSCLCDVDPAKAKAMAKTLGVDLPVYTDYREMLAREELDAVHVCTPHFLHAEMAEAALAAGVNVFLEKPACMTPAEVPALEKAAAESRAKLCVCFQNRFNPSTEKLRDMIADGKLGKVLGGRGIVTWDRGGAYYTLSPWRGKKATEGGSVMINQALHTLDLLQFFCGDPVSVKGAASNFRTPCNDTEDTAVLYLTFPGGGDGLFLGSTAYCRSAPAELEVVTEAGVARLEGGVLTLNGAVIVPSETAAPGKAVWGNGHTRLIDLFYEALEKDLPAPVPLSEGLRALRTVWSLYGQNA